MIEWKENAMECIGVLNKSRYISIIRAKQSKNCRKTKSRMKTKKSQAAQGAHGSAWLGARPCVPPRTMVVTTVSPWWPLVLPVHLFLEWCVLCTLGCFVLGCDFAYVGSFWASFAILFDPHGPQLHCFSYYLAWVIVIYNQHSTNQNRA